MVDAVVVTADSPDIVVRCVERLDDPVIASVTVVDNGSSHGAAAALARVRPDVDVIEMDLPGGLSRAYNRGAAVGSADLVLFLNDDILAERGAIDALVRALTDDAVATAGRLVDADDGTTQMEYQPRSFPTLATFVAAFAGLDRFWRTNPWTGGHRRRPLGDRDVVAVDQPPGACLLIRRSVFEAIGGWDERFEFWYEDVDLARRLRTHGRVLYVPAASFRHVGGHSARRLERSEIVSRSYRGALLYADKHFGSVQRRAAGALFAAVSGARAAVGRGDAAAAYRRVGRDGLELLAGRHVIDGSRRS